MAWSTIRRATSEDIARVAKARERFMDRHNLDEIAFDQLDDGGYGESETEHEARMYLRKLWRRCMRRALQCDADGIAYGHVGYHVD